MKPYFVVEAYTNVGRVRDNNEDNYYVNGRYLENADLEDYFIIDIPTQKGVFGVFDGMGGQSNGEFASYTAAKTLSAYQHDLLKNSDECIEDYVKNANLSICDEMQRTHSKIGTTMGVAVINENKLKIYNIGDTRVYYIRDGKIYQVSKDHTVVNQLVEAGLMTREQAANDERKNQLSQHLGIMPEEMIIQPFISEEIEWGEDDVLLICSDGITDVMSDGELENIVNECSQKGFFAEHIAKTAIRKGSKDNVTVVVVQACGKNGISGKKAAPSKNKYGIVAAILAVCILVGGVAGLLFNKLFGQDPETETTTTTPTQQSSTTNPAESTTPIADSTTEPTGETTSDNQTTLQTQQGDQIAAEPEAENMLPNAEKSTLKLENGAVNLYREPVDLLSDGTVVNTVTEEKEIEVIGFDSSKKSCFWYYIKMEGNYYWATGFDVVDPWQN